MEARQSDYNLLSTAMQNTMSIGIDDTNMQMWEEKGLEFCIYPFMLHMSESGRQDHCRSQDGLLACLPAGSFQLSEINYCFHLEYRVGGSGSEWRPRTAFNDCQIRNVFQHHAARRRHPTQGERQSLTVTCNNTWNLTTDTVNTYH